MKNYIEAFKLLHKAAEQGHAKAQHFLGECYSEGAGVVKNDAEAYKWTLLAAAQGHEKARQNASIIERRLPPGQRVECQRLAAEWQAKYEKARAK